MTRRASINKTWHGGHDPDAEAESHHAVVKHTCRRASTHDLRSEGAGALAALQDKFANSLEGTLVGVTDVDHEHGDDDHELQTNGQAICNMLNNCMGSGILGMANGIHLMGLGVGLLTTVFAAIANTFTILMHMDSSRLANEDPATTGAAEKGMGRLGKGIQLTTYFLMGFSSCISYLTASRDAISDLLILVNVDMKDGFKPQLLMIVIWCTVIVPPTLIRSLTILATLSMLAFLGAVVLVVSAIGCSIEQIMQHGINWETVDMFPDSLSDAVVGFSTLVMLFGAQAGSGVVLGGMKDSSPQNIKATARKSLSIVTFLYSIIGSSAYLAFSRTLHNHPTGDVLLLLPTTSVLGLVARLGALPLVIFSYVIMAIPAKIATIDVLFGANEALQEATPCQFYGVAMGLNVAALAIGLCVKDLSIVFALMAATINPFLSWLLPVGEYLGICSLPETEDSRPIFSKKNWKQILTFFFGLFMVGTGFYNLYVTVTSQ